MKTSFYLRLLLPAIFGLLNFSPTLAQNYNAGIGSGSGGDHNVFVGPYTGIKTTSEDNSFLGYLAGYTNTTGKANSFFGNYAGLLNTTGSYNSFLGSWAGERNTTGNYNNFVGNEAGYMNTSGTGNSFMGAYAGHENTTGSNNSFLGFGSGYYNSIGNFNSYVGTYAGNQSTTSSSNSYFGYYAGAFNTTGERNTIMGAFAASNNSTGNRNVVVGDSTAYFATGSSNVYIGSEAGRGVSIAKPNSAAYNVFVGTQSGFNNTTGKENTFLGRNTGYNNTTGSYNVFAGVQAGQSATTADNNSFIGYQSGFKTTTGYDNAFLGTKSGYQNTTGYYNFYLGKQAGFNNTTGANNAYLGNGAGYLNVNGSANVCIGTYAGYNNLGSSNIFIGFNSFSPVGATLTNSIAIGSKSYVTASNSLVLGSINGVNGAVASTNVGIGTSAPAYRLQLGENSAAKPGTSTWTVASDKRLKRDVATFADGLEVLTKIKPVWFKYNGEAGMPTDKKYVGIIAQEMQKIAPYTVGTFTYQDSTGKTAEYLDYDANALTYILVNSVKEQQAQLVEKDARIEALEVRINKLEQLLTKQVPTASVESDAAARLWQNEPNPTDGTTVIRYLIPQQASQAQLSVYSSSGQLLKSYALSERGEGQVLVETATLPSGIYIYRLVIDGKPIDAKKMLLSK
jgi:trimeric autotransporter adhesin